MRAMNQNWQASNDLPLSLAMGKCLICAKASGLSFRYDKEIETIGVDCENERCGHHDIYPPDWPFYEKFLKDGPNQDGHGRRERLKLAVSYAWFTGGELAPVGRTRRLDGCRPFLDKSWLNKLIAELSGDSGR